MRSGEGRMSVNVDIQDGDFPSAIHKSLPREENDRVCVTDQNIVAYVIYYWS